MLARFPNDAMARIAFAEIEDRLARSRTEATYWDDRADLLYLKVVRTIAAHIAGNAMSVVDIGSNGTPILEWLPNVPVKHSVDLLEPYAGPGVVSTTSDFLVWKAPQRFDAGPCLQVMEHVPEVETFAAKLLRTCEVVIISVPYRWPKGKADFHVHDPVDEDKVRRWFGRDPTTSTRSRSSTTKSA